jgi:hypothetical protein
MPGFVHPALLWGLTLVAVPILIHLINLWRHRRVPWAAMEFLLESKRKNQRWVILRQLLLLLARMAAIAALVLVLAQPLLKNRLGALVGATNTHHIVLLDDSFSMSDRWAQTSAFDRAAQAVARIVHRGAQAGPGQYFTLLRFSRAGDQAAGPKADWHAATIDTGLEEQVASALKKMRPSQTAAGPLAALEAARKLAGEDRGEERRLYVVSDFRARDWRQSEPLREALAGWNESGEVHFVHCVDQSHANLAITALRPQRGLLAAGVAFFMEVSVQNFGRDPARNVSVSFSEDQRPRPAVVIDAIAPGATETRRVLVNFPTAGYHALTASLEADSVADDNVRVAAFDLPLGLPVLVVDGDAEATDARFLSLALAPGGSIRTGVDVELQTPRYLTDHPLAKYRTIYLTNVANLDESAASALEDYVRSGGGLAIFVGEASTSRFLNERLYRQGRGLMPLEVAAPTPLFVDKAQPGPDLEVKDHPLFKIFFGERNSFLNAVRIDRYFSVTKTAEQSAGASASVIARLRNGRPLVIEKKFGQGRVIAFLTTAAPTWNNWGRNPSFVVAMLEMQSYLANQDEPPAPHLVGTPLKIRFPAARYQPRARLVVPGEEEPVLLSANAGHNDGLLEVITDTPRGGVYEADLTTLDGRGEQRLYAVNVAAEEGNLEIAPGSRLAANFRGLRITDHRPEDLDWSVGNLAGFNLSDGVLYLLVALLIGEQMLAYRNTYHPKAWEGRT